jgi:hypothetical protein
MARNSPSAAIFAHMARWAENAEVFHLVCSTISAMLAKLNAERRRFNRESVQIDSARGRSTQCETAQSKIVVQKRSA